MFAIVDISDYEAVAKHRWYAHRARYNFYAARRSFSPSNRQLLFLHNFLLPGAVLVDHKNGNSLDNRRDNLRPCDARKNGRGHRRKAKSATSKFRGVCWDSGKRMWISQIVVDKLLYLGQYSSEIEAARAYDAAARKYFGEFASPNFPKP